VVSPQIVFCAIFVYLRFGVYGTTNIKFLPSINENLYVKCHVTRMVHIYCYCGMVTSQFKYTQAIGLHVLLLYKNSEEWPPMTQRVRFKITLGPTLVLQAQLVFWPTFFEADSLS
jgi:hypothetical protein